ncbi:DUF2231 domain-containing protein [Gordonia sp. CPCC 206044]|uniref:DUF2231 domain-containing protein n=1 Tax=Gordonia sp. CPCC 206044 TaxID=3140793 RepID=UPI003AF3961F
MDTINGIPAHPLLVHFVVVAVPIAAILAVVVVLWPRARTYLGVAPALIALVTLIALPITTSAGESLAAKFPASEEIATHADRGESVIYAVGPLFGLLVVWWLLFSPLVLDRVSLSAGVLMGARVVVGVATVAAAAASLVLVILTGDSGAQAVWG